MVEPAARKEQIVTGIEAAAERVNGVAEIPPDLLAEVVNLVEYPTAVVGKFESEFFTASQ